MTNPVCSCILLTISFKCNDGEKAVSRSFRELPGGARQCGRNVRHWPLSSRIETRVGSDGSPHRYQRGGIRPTGADAGSGYRNIPKRVVPRKFETLSSLAEGDEGAFCFFGAPVHEPERRFCRQLHTGGRNNSGADRPRAVPARRCSPTPADQGNRELRNSLEVYCFYGYDNDAEDSGQTRRAG